MASGEHSCTRRDLLGAAVAVPVVGAIDLPPLPSRGAQRGGEAALDCFAPLAMTEDWARALAAVARAERRVRGFARRTEGRARSFAAQERVDERFTDLVCAHNRTIEALLLTAAPDVGALGLKVVVAVEEQAWELPAGEACMARIGQEARAVAGGALVRSS